MTVVQRLQNTRLHLQHSLTSSSQAGFSQWLQGTVSLRPCALHTLQLPRALLLLLLLLSRAGRGAELPKLPPPNLPPEPKELPPPNLPPPLLLLLLALPLLLLLLKLKGSRAGAGRPPAAAPPLPLPEPKEPLESSPVLLLPAVLAVPLPKPKPEEKRLLLLQALLLPAAGPAPGVRGKEKKC